MRPIKLAILWHQHQPSYRAGAKALLPWAWLHATKDYLEMAQHLERHPGVKVTINLVPSLVRQLEDHLDGTASDDVVTLMTKPAEALTTADKQFMLTNFFRANPGTVIARSKRYRELYEQAYPDPNSLIAPVAFSDGDLRDLAVHFGLAWTGAIDRRREPFARLVAKDRNFTEEEKRELHAAHRASVAEILPLHTALAARGQIELSTSPYFHPILPLLIDHRAARESVENVCLPSEPFAFPEDARAQLERAMTFFAARTGRHPVGLWPSEGSLSMAALELIRETGFAWTASDQDVLARSLGNEALMYQGKIIRPEHAHLFPIRLETSSGPIAVFFRDHRLADDIGFVYQGLPAAEAVQLFSDRVQRIRTELVDAYGEAVLDDACIRVILDGENCWEYYPENGFAFLDGLYAMLGSSDTIRTVTFGEQVTSDSLARMPKLSKLTPGSWINANFDIWIGHPQENVAWDALSRARNAYELVLTRAKDAPIHLRETLRKRLANAMDELLVAEGSDWFWWYGDHHYSDQKHIFDELFRMHLRAVYVALDVPVPLELSSPLVALTNAAAHAGQAKYGAMHRVEH